MGKASETELSYFLYNAHHQQRSMVATAQRAKP